MLWFLNVLKVNCINIFFNFFQPKENIQITYTYYKITKLKDVLIEILLYYIFRSDK